MEIILGIATILGGITAIWFFVDKFRESRQHKKTITPTTAINKPAASDSGNISQVFGAIESGRHPFFYK